MICQSRCRCDDVWWRRTCSFFSSSGLVACPVVRTTARCVPMDDVTESLSIGRGSLITLMLIQSSGNKSCCLIVKLSFASMLLMCPKTPRCNIHVCLHQKCRPHDGTKWMQGWRGLSLKLSTKRLWRTRCHNLCSVTEGAIVYNIMPCKTRAGKLQKVIFSKTCSYWKARLYGNNCACFLRTRL